MRSSFGSIHWFALSFLSSLVLALSLVSRVSARVSEWLCTWGWIDHLPFLLLTQHYLHQIRQCLPIYTLPPLLRRRVVSLHSDVESGMKETSLIPMTIVDMSI